MDLNIFCTSSHKYCRIFFIFIIVCLNYNKTVEQELILTSKILRNNNESQKVHEKYYNNQDIKYNLSYTKSLEDYSKCNALYIQKTNITTSEEFAKFEFQPKWIKSRIFWNETFESRFRKQYNNPQNYPVKIILLLHSHNDPGWLATYAQYFKTQTKSILDTVIQKMIEFTDMTFVWSEICFLELWWKQANSYQKYALKELIDSGRFEIVTGGWVMTDEANVHLYPMIDQLIEGHQWLKNNLNIEPKIGWSIDPFGHGATLPYLLSASNFDGTIIQRIHFGWKYWFANNKNGDFIWQPQWRTSDKINRNLLIHNMPFEMYTTVTTCGPDTNICQEFNFNPYYSNENINRYNVAEKSETLMEQYSRTASLFKHNVGLILIGEDFSYDSPDKLNKQYLNYKKLITYINDNKNYFNTEIKFGTPNEYFEEIRKRSDQFPTLKGDFFVYSDTLDRSPAYWSGYYTNRPYYKYLSNLLEHNLRSSEILYTLTYNIIRQNKNQLNNNLKLLQINYDNIITARQCLGVFQHHDAITGTSNQFVMEDYRSGLERNIQYTIELQEILIEMLLQNNIYNQNFLQNQLRENYVINFYDSITKFFIIFNSLAQKRLEIMKIKTAESNVLILNENGIPVKYQINPIWKYNINNNTINISNTEYEIIFLAELPPLCILKYQVIFIDEDGSNKATIYCNDCNINNNSTIFEIFEKPSGDIQLENQKLRLVMDDENGLLKLLTLKQTNESMEFVINFGAYKTTRSGAYIFKTDDDIPEINILDQYLNNSNILIISGHLATNIIIFFKSFLIHNIRILNTQTYLDNGIYIQNILDLGPIENNKDSEIFIRFESDIQNGIDLPEFYSDQNGFQHQHRIKIPEIRIEGNYYPITTSAFIQDHKKRFTLLTSNSHGAASLRFGELEIMLDRRTANNDYRGNSEGIKETVLLDHKFWLIIEDIKFVNKNNYQVLSLLANKLSNNLRYPVHLYFINDAQKSINLKKKLNFIKYDLPCDIHLLNVRTLTDESQSKLPSRSALVLLHRQGYDCNIGELPFDNTCNNTIIATNTFFNDLSIELIKSTTLTGLNNIGIITNNQRIFIEPMDVQTFNFTFAIQ